MNGRLPRLTPTLILVAAAILLATRDRRGAANAPAVGDSQSASVATSPTAPPHAPITQPPSAQPTVGDKLLMQAVAQLERRSSVYARLRHQSSIGGQALVGVGTYWQQGGGEDLRVRLELQIVGQQASLLQVSNNRFLWIDRNLPIGRNVSRVDLRQLRADRHINSLAPDELQPGQATWSGARPDLLAHCGGVPSLLTRLGDYFSFLPPQPMRFATHTPGDSSSRIPVFAIVGHWKQEKLTMLLSRGERSQAGSVSIPRSLPDRLPREVLVLVGQEDLFPYRVEYRQLETMSNANRDGLPVPYQLSANPLVVLEFCDVAFDVPIAAGQFDYAPGDADWVDHTTAALERLRRERQEELATRGGADRR